MTYFSYNLHIRSPDDIVGAIFILKIISIFLIFSEIILIFESHKNQIKMTIILDLELDTFIEENADQRERLIALLRDSIETTIRMNFKAASLNGMDISIDDE